MKKEVFPGLILLCLAMSISCYSQSKITQSLIDSSNDVVRFQNLADSLARLAYAKSVELDEYWGIVNSLQTLGYIYFYHDQLDSSAFYYDRALQLALATNDKREIADSYSSISSLKERRGELEEAISLMEKSLELQYEVKDTTAISNSYMLLGMYYSNHGNHEKAISNYLSGLELSEIINNLDLSADLYQGVGIIYNKQKDFEKAEPYFTKAMNSFIQLKDTIGQISVHNDFGILNKNRGQYKVAEQEYLKMLELASYPGYQWAKVYAYDNLGVLYYNLGQYEKGIEYNQRGLDIWDGLNNPRPQSGALNYLAKNHLAVGNVSTALQHATKSLALAKQAKSLEKQRDVLLTLSEVHEKTNKPLLALQYFKEHKIYYDSVYNAEKTELIHGLEKKYATEKKDKEIAIMAKNAELDEVKNTRLWIGLGATVLFGTLLLWFLIQRHRKQQEIDKEKRKVSDLENKRLNQELDFKKQELTSKVLQLVRKNEFLQSLNKQVKDLKTDLNGPEKNQVDRLSRQINRDMDADADWEQFLKSFESVHPDFNRTVNQIYPNFTAGEIRMACLFKMNLGTNEIANLLNITSDGVKKTRHRMRKKMGLDSSLNLTEHFINLGMEKPVYS